MGDRMGATPNPTLSSLPRTVLGPVLGALLATLAVANPAAAAPHGPPTGADFTKLQDELTRVQQELRDQRQLILQLMQMHDALLKYVQLGGAAPAGARPAAPAPAAALPEPALPPAASSREAPPEPATAAA